MTAKDTILIVSTSFPAEHDGSEAAGGFVADFADELAKLIPTRVVGPGNVESVEEANVSVWRFAAGDKALSLLSPANPLHWIAILRTLRSLRKQVTAACADGRVKHILALWVLPSGWAARSAARNHGITYSVWALGSDIWSLGKLPVVRNLLGRVGKEAKLAFADGIQLGKDAEKLCNRPFEFLPSSRKLSGVRSRPVATTPPYRLLFLGRWHPNKGIDLLLEALHLLDNEDWQNIEEVHIAGGGPMDSIVRHEVEKLRKAGRPLRISGYQSKLEAEALLGKSDWLLIPSRIESIPVILTDAMTMGLPVIATPTGDIPAIISKSETGVLSSGCTAFEFAEATRTALTKRKTINITQSPQNTQSYTPKNSAIIFNAMIGNKTQ